jgi:hypothetical protein
MYICHKGEDGDKDHIHLRIEPNKSLDQMDLTEALKQYPEGAVKPLGVRPWRPSKEEDWLLYAVHDADYLKAKYHEGEKGEKLPYKWQDIKASEGYDVEIAYIRARSYLEHTNANIIKRLSEGTAPVVLAEEGLNPFTVNSIIKLWEPREVDRLRRENEELRKELRDYREHYETLLASLHEWGFTIGYDGEGNFYLDDTKPYNIQGNNDFVEAP